ncbi:MAG: ABC transporter permease subunit [Dehalococcoidales bacterium]|jgi:ABC-type transport system involved in multi-copper enzyme maturation permease subunit|nr:ABC transporter permease subunit [Dehalococcoidales bacterium]
MIDMIRAELFKLRKRSMTWILLIILATFFCLMFFATYGIISSPPDGMHGVAIDEIKASLQFPGVFNTIFSTAGTIGTLLMIILGASSIGNEYGWGSIRQVLTRRGIRYHFVISKLVSLIIVAFIGLLISVVIGSILALITSNLLGSVNWDSITASLIREQLANFGWTLFALLPYILMATFFAFLGRSAIAGIGGGLGFYFIESIAVSLLGQAGGWLSKIPDYLIGPNVTAIMPPSPFSQGMLPSAGTSLSTLHATLTLTVYCIVFLTASLYMFKKRDITA